MRTQSILSEENSGIEWSEENPGSSESQDTSSLAEYQLHLDVKLLKPCACQKEGEHFIAEVLRTQSSSLSQQKLLSQSLKGNPSNMVEKRSKDATRLEAIATGVDAIATRVEAIASRLE